MERQDLYLKPNAKKLALAIGFDALFCVAMIIINNNGNARIAGDVIGLLAIVGLPATFVWMGWDGRRELGYRWIDTVIASLANGIFAMVALMILVVSFVHSTTSSESGTPETWTMLIGVVLLFTWPIFFALLGHAATRFGNSAAKYLAQPAAKPTETKKRRKD